MIFLRKIQNLTILLTVFLVASITTTAWGQIVTLTELTKDFDISDMVSIKLSGSYKLESGIYRLAIILSHPDKSGVSLKPKVTQMHYLIVGNKKSTETR